MVEGRAGDQHAAWLTQRLQAGGDVDTVAQQVVALHHHIPEIDTNAERDPAVGGVSAWRAAAAFCTATEQATASTTDANSTIAPSPISFTIRPLCSANSGSIACSRKCLMAASVPASSSSISRE